MPTPTTYSYTKATDIPRLTLEISASSIVTALDHMNLTGTALGVVFKDALSDADKTTLDALVAAHSGLPLPAANLAVGVSSTPAFAAKTVVVNGVTKNLFKRVVGIRSDLTSGDNTVLYTETFALVKFMALEVVGGEIGDYVSLYVLDTTTGTFTGDPNHQLNQFGFTANVAKDFYQHKSEFDADVYAGLQIKLVYHSVSAKTIGVNFVMNEVK
jgi:hypothetical protein